ncbi:MAG: hypothetical protein KC729_16720 [Candidatus Eisenbacteria bacterium]|uniref:DUF1460 domain-containing protein n=1 Tax=Eiseniibacteriota bacterium TaxID=2212470 RepID=A0A956M195_UNCEI|nr:hypothetical protein [Candidatus Eisenbacteria bacterium]
MKPLNPLISWRRGALAGLLLCCMIAPVRGSGDSDRLLERFQKMVRSNLDTSHVVASDRLDAAMRLFQDLPLGERVAAWASWFADLGGIEYRYGRGPGGYVTEGRICQDDSTDCVLFMYRVTELARSTSAEEAVQFAFGTRFYGASIDQAVRDDGTVDYDNEAHLEYSEDMIHSEIWGKDVTESVGLSLEELGGIKYVPSASIEYGALQNGDIIWFVGDPAGTALGSEADPESPPTVVQHVGILDRRRGEVDLVHAAARPILGVYDHPGVVRIPLQAYLHRVDRFRGIVVTRLVEF